MVAVIADIRVLANNTAKLHMTQRAGGTMFWNKRHSEGTPIMTIHSHRSTHQLLGCSIYLCWLLLSSAGFAQTQTPLTYERIIELVELEVKEEKLLALIQSQPTVYTLSPAQVARLKSAGASDAVIAALSPKVGAMIESDTSDYVIILDVSASMKETSRDGNSKWQVARKAACDLINEIPAGLSIAIVVYGHNLNKPCDVEVIRALSPLAEAEKGQIVSRISSLEPAGKTPIGKSLQVAAAQVAGSHGIAKLILITDGIETCNGDPVAEAAAFVAASSKGRSIDVIGFDLADQESGPVSMIAKSGKGKYTEAKTGEELTTAINSVKQEMSQVLKTTDGAIKLSSSKSPAAPTQLPIDRYTTARLAPKNEHYWQVDFPAGKFTIVYDVKTSNDSRQVLGEVALGTYDGSKFTLEEKASVYANEVRARNVINIEFSKPTQKLIRVTSLPGMTGLEDYQIGVFGAESNFGVPFLVNSPEVRRLALGQTVTSPLLGTDPAFFKDRSIVYKVTLPPGDFKLECTWIKEKGNKSDGVRAIRMLDEQGVFQKSVSSGIMATAAEAVLQTADETTMLLEFVSGTPKEKVQLKITPVPN